GRKSGYLRSLYMYSSLPLAGNHAVIIPGHQVNETACCGQGFARDSQNPEAPAHARRIGKLEGNDQVRMWRRLHCGLSLIIKAPNHGISLGECGKQTWKWRIGIHQLLSHIFGKVRTLGPT